MNTEWTGQDSETSVRSPVLGVAGLLVRQKGPGGVSKEATGFGEEVYTVLTPESRGRGEKADGKGEQKKGSSQTHTKVMLLNEPGEGTAALLLTSRHNGRHGALHTGRLM